MRKTGKRISSYHPFICKAACRWIIAEIKTDRKKALQHRQGNGNGIKNFTRHSEMIRWGSPLLGLLPTAGRCRSWIFDPEQVRIPKFTPFLFDRSLSSTDRSQSMRRLFSDSAICRQIPACDLFGLSAIFGLVGIRQYKSSKLFRVHCRNIAYRWCKLTLPQPAPMRKEQSVVLLPHYRHQWGIA